MMLASSSGRDEEELEMAALTDLGATTRGSEAATEQDVENADLLAKEGAGKKAAIGKGIVKADFEEEEEPSAAAVMAEFKLFGKLALPAVLIQLSFSLQNTYTSTYVGRHFGTVALTGFSLANLSGNLVVLSLVMGLLSAAETLTPQAFSLKQYREVGQICARSFFLCLFLLTPLGPILMYMDKILVFLGQPEESAALAKEFLDIYAFAYPALVFCECALRFYRAQNVTLPFVWLYVFVLCMHPVYVHLFAEVFEFGFQGAPMAHVASMNTLALLIFILFRFGKQHHPETFPASFDVEFWRKALLDKKGAWLVVQLGIPGIMSNSEWWFWEVVCFITGQAGTASLAAHTIAYSLIPLAFMIPLGYAIGLSSQVGQLLAVGKVLLAKKVARIGTIACCLTTTTFSVCIFIFRDAIVSSFTDDPQVKEQANAIWPWVCVFLLGDAIFGVTTGLIRALALQAQMSYAVLLSLWMLGMPLVLFTFKYLDRGVLGIWQSMPVIYFLLDSLLVICVLRKDWREYSRSISAKFDNTDDSYEAKNLATLA
ncbi:Multidrug and toxin extrusion protein 1 [Hondaea fermentalgiana]|uniref:Multidrug and toxin extrusion protein 1 n=1 Tax=Hondaea fermentalgiana TaxID=2315210 RepID=A0A2R5G6T1_9STRA|nr:Multidrug and toxin extrusion protein 1 [Hondaea fermentalgiana]|eukprot:GBG26756.1 Multidrug and toxin extrusion protein 1 [Hondaea fermentalgiana]